MTTIADVRITPATREHAPSIAWVMLTAARSHLERGMWDLLTDASEPETLRFLEAVASSEEPHWAHHSLFLVAEVDGRPASALAGYLEREFNPRTMALPVQAAFHAMGRTDADLAQGWARAGSIGLVAEAMAIAADRETSLHIDPATGIPAHDPETMRTDVDGVYIAGVIAAGHDANKIFIENGRFHGDRIVADRLVRRGR